MDMGTRDYFDHYTPEGLGPGDRIDQAGYEGSAWGENIAWGYPTPEAVVAGWMNSPGHRANILRDEYTHLGVGISTKGRKMMATQNFAAIIAYIDLPVPLKVSKGAELKLEATPLTTSVNKPNMFDFYMPRKNKKAGDSLKIANAKAEAPPGVYQLRFYFPDKTGYKFDIYTGPQIEVE